MSYTRTPNKFTDVKPKYVIPYKPHPKTGNPMLSLEGEVKEIFIKLFPKHTNPEMMKLFGVSHSTINRLARSLGLQKDMKAIKRKQIKAMKKTCESNGYYASLRGKVPSQACLDGYKRKLAEGYHPLRQLKQSNPRRYKKICRQRSEKRKELVHRERLRMDYGLPRLTRMLLSEQPLRSTAFSQKHAMIRTHNYFADPDHSGYVCYDSETRRSLRMEATARKHGLQVVEAYDDEPTETESENETTISTL